MSPKKKSIPHPPTPHTHTVTFLGAWGGCCLHSLCQLTLIHNKNSKILLIEGIKEARRNNTVHFLRVLFSHFFVFLFLYSSYRLITYFSILNFNSSPFLSPWPHFPRMLWIPAFRCGSTARKNTASLSLRSLLCVTSAFPRRQRPPRPAHRSSSIYCTAWTIA